MSTKSIQTKMNVVLAVVAIMSCSLYTSAQNTRVIPVKNGVGNKIKIMKTASVEQPLKITSHSDGANIAGAIQILGTGKPGLKIVVRLYAFASVTPKTSMWETFKTIVSPTTPINVITGNMAKKGKQIKERFYNDYHVTIDANGKWYIPVFQSFGSPDWIRQAFIPFAWVVSAYSEDPNYRDGNNISIKLKSGN